jgi:hypothetical protein
MAGSLDQSAAASPPALALKWMFTHRQPSFLVESCQNGQVRDSEIRVPKDAMHHDLTVAFGADLEPDGFPERNRFDLQADSDTFQRFAHREPVAE